MATKKLGVSSGVARLLLWVYSFLQLYCSACRVCTFLCVPSQSEANLLLSRFRKFSYTAFLSCVTSGVFNSTHRLLRCSKSLPKLIKEEEQAKKKRNKTMVALPSSPYPDHQAPYVESSAGQSLYHQGQSETETRSLPPPTADRRSPSSPSLVGWQLQPIQQQQQQPSSCSPPSSRDVYGSQAYSMLPQEPLTTHPQQVLAAAYPSPSTQLVPSAYLPQVMNSQGMAAIVSPPSAPSGGAYTLQNPLPHMSSSPHVIVSTPHQGCESSVLQNQPSGTTPPHSLPVPHRPQDSFLPTRSNFLSQPAGPPMPSPPLPFPVSSQGGATLSSPTRPPLPPNTMVLAAHPPQIQESFFPSVYQGQETPLLPTGGVRSSFPEKIRDENDDVNGKRTFDEKARQGLVGGEEEGVRLGIQGPHVVSSPLHPPSDVGYAGLPYSSVQRFSGTEKRSFRASSPTHCFRGGRPESYDLITEPLRGRHGNPLRPVTSPEPPVRLQFMRPLYVVHQAPLYRGP